MDLSINNTYNIPKCVSDLTIYQEKFLGKNKYFMISDQRKKYLKLNKIQYDFYNQIIVLMDGSHTKQDFEKKLVEITHGNMKADQVIDVMYRNNLLENKYEEPKSKVELELSSTKVMEIPLENFQKKHSGVINSLDTLINVVGILAILYSLYLVFFNLDLIAEVIRETRVFSWTEIAPFDFVTILVLSFISVPIHEMGHLLMANRCGTGWKSFTFSLKWGINPVYYIKYYGFYTINSLKKIKILLSGVYFNLIQACIYFILLVHLLDWRMAVLSIINLGCIVSCLMPSGTSDGYHLISIIFGIEGIRWKMIELISNIIKSPGEVLYKLREKENIALLFYFLISYGMGIYSCYILLLSLIDYLHIFAIDKGAVIIGLTVLVLVSVGYNFVQFINRLKKV